MNSFQMQAFKKSSLMNNDTTTVYILDHCHRHFYVMVARYVDGNDWEYELMRVTTVMDRFVDPTLPIFIGTTQVFSTAVLERIE